MLCIEWYAYLSKGPKYNYLGKHTIAFIILLCKTNLLKKSVHVLPIMPAIHKN